MGAFVTVGEVVGVDVVDVGADGAAQLIRINVWALLHDQLVEPRERVGRQVPHRLRGRGRLCGGDAAVKERVGGAGQSAEVAGVA